MYERATAMIDDTVVNENWSAARNREPADGEAKKAWLAAWNADWEQRVELLWLNANQEPLRLALAATRRPECIFDMFVDPQGLQRRAGPAQRLIATDARYLRREGDLDGELDRKMALLRMSVHLRNHQFLTAEGDFLEQKTLWELRDSWAARPGQTPEWIRACIKALDEWHKTVPRPSDEIEARYIWFGKVLSLDPEPLSAEASVNEYFKSRMNVLLFTAHLMPWERTRARRALDDLTLRELAGLRGVEAAIEAEKPTALLVLRQPKYVDNELLRTTPWLSAIAPDRIRSRSSSDESRWVESETNRQATRLLLALVGWRLEHGALPESLDALIGSYFDELPRDPWSGRPFRYFPRGTGQGPSLRNAQGQAIGAATPVIWSCGPGLVAGNEEEALGWRVEVPPLGRQSFGSLPPMIREAHYFPIHDGALYIDALPLDAALPRGVAMPIPKPDASVEP